MFTIKQNINPLRQKKKFKDIKVCKNENELFKNKSINLICICSYDNFHFKHVKKSILQKKRYIYRKTIMYET